LGWGASSRREKEATHLDSGAHAGDIVGVSARGSATGSSVHVGVCSGGSGGCKRRSGAWFEALVVVVVVLVLVLVMVVGVVGGFARDGSTHIWRRRWRDRRRNCARPTNTMTTTQTGGDVVYLLGASAVHD
jgi:predicted alpha/beta hydrolase